MQCKTGADLYVALSSDMLEEAIPGNIRKAEHFIAFLKRFIEYLKVRLTIFLTERDPMSF